MQEQKFSAIILAGGTSSRMRFETEIPKQCLAVIGNKSMIKYQIEWLNSCGIVDITLATNNETYDYILNHMPYIFKKVHTSIEETKLDTGGAIRNAVENIVKTDNVYFMNVDDFIFSEFYTPDQLVSKIDSFYGAVLTSRGTFPYGVLKTKGECVTGFEQKPVIDTKVYAGHGAFKCSYILSKFPKIGSFESMTLPTMTKKRELTFMDLDGEWLTANTYKELKTVQEKLLPYEDIKKYGSYALRQVQQ